MNQLARRVTAIATGQESEPEPEPIDEKARKRGEARAKQLTAKERSEIARKAARARWGE
jgi:hypothetical protein